jgi:hypothetical protein
MEKHITKCECKPTTSHISAQGVTEMVGSTAIYLDITVR